MLKAFQYDGNNNTITLQVPELLLIKEFKALMENKRNKCSEDVDGKLKLRAFREFTYIYLAIDWGSPYNDYPAQEKHLEALRDSKLTEEEFNDETFRAACRKYEEIQNSIRAVKAAQRFVEKLINYFDNVNPEERNNDTGKPIFSVKELMGELNKLQDTLTALKNLETQVKKEMSTDSDVWGGAEDGFDDY